MQIRSNLFSVALGALVLLSAGKSFGQVELWTTLEDFVSGTGGGTGWFRDGTNLDSSPTTDFDSDGSSINGGGNVVIASRGGPGTPGGMAVFNPSLSTYAFQYSPELINNPTFASVAFRSPSLRIQFDIFRTANYIDNPTNPYFAGGLVYNYAGGFDLHGDPGQGATIIYQADGKHGTVTVDAPIVKTSLFDANGNLLGGTYFQFGITWNTNELILDPSLPVEYVDNFRLIPVEKGDFNLDGHVDGRDISVMESALADPTGYLSTHPITAAELNATVGDFDGDTKLTNVDFQGFLNYLKAGSGNVAAVPEPASLVLVGLAIPAVVAVARRRRK